MHGMCRSSSGYGCGLSIVLLQLAYSIEIWISNVTTSNNWAWNGANIFLYGKDCTNSSFRIENTVSLHGRGNRGTGLLFQWDSSTDSYLCARERISHQIVLIDSSQFATNTAMQRSAVEVSTHSSLMVSNQISATGYHFVLRNSSIVFNTILIATQHSATFNFTGNGKALFQNVNISHNSYSTSAGFILGTVTPSPKILGVHKSDGRLLSLDCLNCNFSHNTNATVLELINGSISIRFQGTTIFAKNINAMKRSILYLYLFLCNLMVQRSLLEMEIVEGFILLPVACPLKATHSLEVTRMFSNFNLVEPLMQHFIQNCTSSATHLLRRMKQSLVEPLL